jgi:hypothetical protein
MCHWREILTVLAARVGTSLFLGCADRFSIHMESLALRKARLCARIETVEGDEQSAL